MNACGRLALGTAQWGAVYGITNSAGRPSSAMVERMLGAASRAGVAMLDTACAYGEAEQVIGAGIAVRDFEVVTKTDPRLAAGAEGIEASIEASLAALGRERVYALLVHHGEILLTEGAAHWRALERAKRRGIAGKIGVSVYHPEVLRMLLDRFSIEVVQLPASLYDQRFARSGLLDELARRGVEVHVRSIFLQGLILLAPEHLPAHFSDLARHQRRLHAHLAAQGLTPFEGALRHALGDPRVARVVVGTETEAQLDALLAAAPRAQDALPPTDLAEFALEDERVVLPFNWPTAARAFTSATNKEGNSYE